MKGQEILLPGKIAVELGTGVPNDTCVIYDGDKVNKFVLNNTKLNFYKGLTWLNTEDAFLATQTIKNDKRTKNLQSNIVKIDLEGNIIDRIFESEYPQGVGLTHLSPKDSKLLFISSKAVENAGVIRTWNRPQTMVIMDFKSKQVIKTLDPVGALHLGIDESPWLPDESHFVYSITNAREVEVRGESPMKMEEKPGVYLYDLSKGTNTLIAPDATHAMSSPVRDEIAFMKDGRIGIFKLNDNSIKWLFDFRKSSVMHWSPDGDYIYLLDYNYLGNGSEEKLIRVSDGEEVPFKKVKHGYYSYTWK